MHGPEYEERLTRPFVPPSVTFTDVNNAVPRHLRAKSTVLGLYYTGRDVSFAYAFYALARYIDHAPLLRYLGPWAGIARWALWGIYWFWQGVVFAGFWCLAHEAGHGNLSSSPMVNHTLGFTLHSFLLIPYFSWRSTHHTHHKYTSSIEHDTSFVPYTRTEYSLPPKETATKMDYEELLEDMPLYTLYRMIIMQLLGMQIHLMNNVMGGKDHSGMSHFSPNSTLFEPKERKYIIASDLGIAAMAVVLSRYTSVVGLANTFKLYGVPYLLANHWVVMLTYLHHSDPTLPHYRDGEWSWLRGGLATIDRPLLGWVGRFFLHNVSHDHLGHHLFPTVPFYNQPQVTEALKGVLKDDYNYDSTNTFYALYRTFTNCVFVEDDGKVVMYKDTEGKALRALKGESNDNPKVVSDPLEEK